MSANPILKGAPVPVHGLHHTAYRCRDAEETRHFYEDILGLPLVHVIKADSVPSTGENHPYVHLFFAFQDGSCIAFFDLGDDQAAVPSPNTPKWVTHIAFRVESLDELSHAKARLQQAGIDVLGAINHHFVHSIYFFDPNGVRLELTCEVAAPSYAEEKRRTAHAELSAWTEEKARIRAARPQLSH
ncbi:MAG: VOC family protein [Betaproteobacteria bacterium]|nr:VOC family protein [Betaproteobacteria bacterium]